MPHTSSDIYWEEHGQGPLTLVMLPGFGASAESMTGIARHLSGFRVLIFDLPGHGQSVRAPADGSLPRWPGPCTTRSTTRASALTAWSAIPWVVRSRCVSRLTTRMRCVR